jgi:hypothetical protein
MSPLETALEYIARGWNPVPIPFRSKRPIGNNWQTRSIDVDAAPHFFNGGPQNIGVLMGATSHGLTNADLDCKEAVAIGPFLLPPTGAIFGRASKRYSHRLYYTDLSTTCDQAAIQLRAPDGAMLVELRIGGGDKGAQTVFPASFHKETGEEIKWEEDGEPADVDGAGLVICVKLVAAAALIARAWPAPGGRHDAARVVGGFRARAGLAEEKIKLVAEAIARAAGDEEWRDRIKAAEDAARAFHNGDKTYGLPKLTEIAGEKAAKRIAEWLDYDVRSQPSAIEKLFGNQPQPVQPTPITLHWHGDAKPERQKCLVANILPGTGVGLISGQWGLYKTFVALELAGAVMSGDKFINFPVLRRGGVMFVAMEGANTISQRLQALLTAKYPNMTPAPFAWTDQSPALLDPNAAETLIALAKQADARMQERFGLPLGLIIIDTIVASAGYTKSGEENDAAINATIMGTLGTVSRRTGALVLGVDHFGKAVETGTRGSSAKEGAADVVLALLGERAVSGEVTNTRLAVRKNRAGASGQEFPFTVHTVDLGVDDEGRLNTSLVIEWQAAPQHRPSADQGTGWSKSLRLLQRALMNVLVDHGHEQRPFADGPLVRAVDIEIIRAEFYKSYPTADVDAKKKQETRRKAFSRAVRDAQERSLIGVREVEETTLVWLVQNAPTRSPEETQR